MTPRHSLLLIAFVLLTGSVYAEEATLPFSMPIPEGWRTETIPFPLEFAPTLPYTGLEELRFAPGMFQEGDDDFWTYAFVWWVESEEPSDAASLSSHLKTYFRGLAAAVAQGKELDLGEAEFSASIRAGEADTFEGTAETFDAFVTAGQVRLNIRGEVRKCPDQGHKAIFFGLSPKDRDHPVWSDLDSIRQGFRCQAH